MGSRRGASVLEVENLCKEYGGPGKRTVRALDGVSLSLDAGEALGLVGHTGSGKTTLALCITRLEIPTSGRVIFEGRDWLALKRRKLRALRRNMAMVFQDPFGSLNPLMKVASIIDEPMAIAGSEGAAVRRRKVWALLDDLGLNPELSARRAGELSGGQRQRVAIARALACSPTLLIADEPVSALDLESRARVLSLFKSHQSNRGMSLLIILHDLETARACCDRVGVMCSGELVEVGPTRQIFEAPAHPYSKTLLNDREDEP